MRLGVVVAQVPVGHSVRRNLAVLLDAMAVARAGDVLITPEGSLSGYLARGSTGVEHLAATDPAELSDAIETLAAEASRRAVHAWFGVCHREDGAWSNDALGLLGDGTRLRYRKVNLATAEREVFRPGGELPVFEIPAASAPATVGVQLCRELRFPEQWRSLAERGARAFLHLNNGLAGPGVFETWRAMLVARAAENERFVVSANAAAASQHCPSAVVAPDGTVLAELPAGALEVRRVELDLEMTADRYLGQRRRDLGL